MTAPALLWPRLCRLQVSPLFHSISLSQYPAPAETALVRIITYRHHGLWGTQASQVTNANYEGTAGRKVMVPAFQEAGAQLEELGKNEGREGIVSMTSTLGDASILLHFSPGPRPCDPFPVSSTVPPSPMQLPPFHHHSCNAIISASLASFSWACFKISACSSKLLPKVMVIFTSQILFPI